jgi:hypothetical protein
MPPRFAGLHGHRTKLVIVLRGCGARGRSGRYKAVEIRAFVTSGEQQANSCDRQIELSHVAWKNIIIGSGRAQTRYGRLQVELAGNLRPPSAFG